MSRPTLIGLHSLAKIREALTYGVTDREYQRLLDEQATFYRREPDLFAQRSLWTDPHGTSRSPGLRCCDPLESGDADAQQNRA